MREAAKKEGLHEGAITFIDLPDRKAIIEMLKLEGIIDLEYPAAAKD